MKKNTVLRSANVKTGIAFICWLLALACGPVLSAQTQKNVSPSLVRDTIYSKNGLVYYGRITHHDPEESTRLMEPKGWSIVFQAQDIQRIAWSERSRIKFADVLVSLDSIVTIDILYLKDGSILRGNILEYRQAEWVRFQMKAGEVVIQETDIDRIVQEPEDPLVARLLKQQKKEKVYAFRETGFYATTVFAILPGGGDYSSAMGLSLQTSFGHQFNRKLGIGLGASIDGYANANGGDTFLPLFLEARGYIWKKIRTPYWVVAGGYGFPLRTNSENQEIRRFEGGYMFHPAIGYRLGGEKAINMTIDLGYKFQKALTEREFFFSGEILTRDVVYRRLSIRMSVIF